MDSRIVDPCEGCEHDKCEFCSDPEWMLLIGPEDVQETKEEE